MSPFFSQVGWGCLLFWGIQFIWSPCGLSFLIDSRKLGFCRRSSLGDYEGGSPIFPVTFTSQVEVKPHHSGSGELAAINVL